MDGNARWAKKKSLPTQLGHKSGTQNVVKIVESCSEIGIKYLTLYAFSSENWNRPKSEISYLMNLLESYIDNESTNLLQKNVRVVISGNLSKIESSLQKKILSLENQSKSNSAITLNIAFSYGSRQEIIDATKKIAAAYKSESISIDEIDEDFFAKNLYQPEIPDPDLVIRTAGDLRLSNFLLWQSAYSELYFTDKFWPDFNQNDLFQAITNFNQRERRYGTREAE